MSTNIERVAAHDEKQNSLINFPRIPYGNLRNVVEFFPWKKFFKAEKKINTFTPHASCKHAK